MTYMGGLFRPPVIVVPLELVVVDGMMGVVSSLDLPESSRSQGMEGKLKKARFIFGYPYFSLKSMVKKPPFSTPCDKKLSFVHFSCETGNKKQKKISINDSH